MCTVSVTIALVIAGRVQLPTMHAAVGFFISGLIGLNIADLFLLSAFTQIGAARTLIVFGFQPLIVGVGALYFFNQPLNPMKLVAVVFLIACLFTLSLEKFRTENHWALKGLLFALAGVALDACGILLSRGSFAASPETTVLEAQFWRCLGAMVGFGVIALFHPFNLVKGLTRWSPRQRALILIASVSGTFLSLVLYMSAIKIGHLASLASITITGPVFATALECAYHRRWPSRYLTVAFGFFAIGFYILVIS